nr:MAG TPA: hypothetical protein [Caudoviricetes sp.]
MAPYFFQIFLSKIRFELGSFFAYRRRQKNQK